MWAHAASITEKYMHHQEIFYRRARKYIELDEMKGSGEVFCVCRTCSNMGLGSSIRVQDDVLSKSLDECRQRCPNGVDDGPQSS